MAAMRLLLLLIVLPLAGQEQVKWVTMTFLAPGTSGVAVAQQGPQGPQGIQGLPVRDGACTSGTSRRLVMHPATWHDPCEAGIDYAWSIDAKESVIAYYECVALNTWTRVLSPVKWGPQ